jgi:hypothetical protein
MVDDFHVEYMQVSRLLNAACRTVHKLPWLFNKGVALADGI